jgi:hypothetical protein
MNPVQFSSYDMKGIGSLASGPVSPLKTQPSSPPPESPPALNDELLITIPAAKEHPPAPEKTVPSDTAPLQVVQDKTTSPPEKPAQSPSPVVLFQEEEAPVSEPRSLPDTPQSTLSSLQLDLLVGEVAVEKKKFGLQMQPPCEGRAVCSLKDRVKEELSAPLPGEYEAFLQKTNGLDHEGIVFYGSTPSAIAGFDDRELGGIIEANKDHRDMKTFNNYLVLGESEDMIYAYHPESSRYVALDSSSLDENESFDSFRQMLRSALDTTA